MDRLVSQGVVTIEGDDQTQERKVADMGVDLNNRFPYASAEYISMSELRRIASY
jgi:hypothetical protein